MRTKFIEKTLSDIADFFKWGFFAEFYAKKPGLLQKIKPEIKLVYLFVVIIYINFLHDIGYLASYYINLLILAYLSKVDLWFFQKRILLLVPLFGGIILLPSVFNFAIDGTPIFFITKHIYITSEGLQNMLVMLLRMLVCISYVILINLTTPWHKILNALEFFRVPKVIIVILNMSYRYFYLLIKNQQEMHYALKSRMIKTYSIKDSYKLLGFHILSLFKKTSHITDQTYKAMISRGYNPGM